MVLAATSKGQQDWRVLQLLLCFCSEQGDWGLQGRVCVLTCLDIPLLRPAMPGMVLAGDAAGLGLVTSLQQ